MRALILAAGFGTRLEKGFTNYVGPYKEKLAEWVENKPKGLVPIDGKPIIDYQLEQLTRIGVDLSDVYVQTNSKYHQQFLKWAMDSGVPEENIFNNGVTKNEDRNEQMKDLLLALNDIGYDQPLVLFASDTLVYGRDGGLLGLSSIKEACQRGYSAVVAYYKPKEAHKHGVITFNDEGMLLDFREKPEGVNAGYVNASVYLFSQEKLAQMKKHSRNLLENYRNPLELLTNQVWVMQAARRLDLGTIDDVLNANGLQ